MMCIEYSMGCGYASLYGGVTGLEGRRRNKASPFRGL